ncbi:starvation-inducible protein [Alteromonas aestuariivivens]|uniref:Starvation-inducible protein n=1 Tax=Alteromonas aestuariivivens TaxID=1938339 RepID=A0A3D8M527_9ALTE|nr:Slp family lipoprotein [Alteromonas aestuariivivens]RDV24645.1 starvation-inducible protein [Alteromonas aestuariivivens]
MFYKYLILVSVVLFSGCAIVPDSIKVPDDTQLVSYTRAVTQSQAVQGQTARWGGIIVGVENKPQQTLIEVVHFPLNHYGRPSTQAETVGRFKARIDGFVDPIVFENGRSVTFVGSVAAAIAGMVGEQPYMYPVIDVTDYHLWRKETVYDVSTLYFDYGTGWYSPFYYPYYGPRWGGWGVGHSRVRVIESRGQQPGTSRVKSGTVQSRPSANVPQKNRSQEYQ